MSAVKVVQLSGGWLARLSPRLVSAVNNMLHQWKASLPLYAMFLLHIEYLRIYQLSFL